MKASIKTVFALLLGVVLLAIGFMLVVQHFQTKAADRVADVGELRYESYKLADELRQSSDDLTRMARTYVITADPKWEQQYLEVLDIRNGKKQRPTDPLYWDIRAADLASTKPIGEAVALQALMQRAGFSDAEFGKLREAQANSDDLVRTETVAMNLVKGNYDDGKGGYTKKGKPDLEKAREMMHDLAYHQAKGKIMKPIGEFLESLDARTREATQAAVAQYLFWARVAQGVQVLSIVLCIGLVVWAYRTVSGVFGRVKHVAATIASGDLTHEVGVDGKDEASSVMGSLANMQHTLRSLVADIRNSAESIQVASSEVAAGNLDLSNRTEQAASSLEQTASAMEQLTATIRQTADSADMAKRLASSATTVAERGGEVVTEVVSTMELINASSKKIAEIISVIDGIAFQTNILALNAAVEAARAGEQGRGFAVVAGEVRALAQRSAGAAKQIKELIVDSVDKIDAGSRQVMDAGTTMSEIVSSVRRVSDIVGEISAATIEQSGGISQMSTAITELDRTTQQNAALVEQGAAAADSLKDQARSLTGVVATFRAPAMCQ